MILKMLKILRVKNIIIMPKYYAVVCGKIPGIYTNWKQTESMIKGFPGAIYKSFNTESEAIAFIQKSSIANSIAPHTEPLINKSLIYTDGSFKNNVPGFGIVIVASNGDKIISYGKIPESVYPNGATNNIAELYAIYVALSLVNGDIILYTDSRYSIACFTTYIHNWIQNGWDSALNRNIIEGTYCKIIGRNVDFQYVKSHSGFKLNVEANKLADKGRLGDENLIVFKNDIKLNM